jgi:phosphoglycerate kinase
VSFLTLDDLEVTGCRVLVRSDFNVPIDSERVTDAFRIGAGLPTIDRLRHAGAKVVVCSHLGRPTDREPELSLGPVAARLEELGGFPVPHLGEVVGPEAEAAVGGMAPGEVLLLENTRFEPGETKNDPELADRLSRLADLFVQDAFGSVHRAHASTVGVAERLRSAAGLLLAQEVESLGRLLEDPQRPYIVVLGGAKVSDKLGVIENLLPRVDAMLIGGGMCFTLLAALGLETGKSLREDDQVEAVGRLLEGPHGYKLILPTDLVVADRFDAEAEARVVGRDAIPPEAIGLDIGPETAAAYRKEVVGAGSVFWNGPMGVFEWERFRAGTEVLADGLALCQGFTVVGGGDSAAALRLLGRESSVSHLSTGGGAGLEMLEGKELPGLAVLRRWAE